MHDTTLWPDPGRFPPLPSVQGPVGLSTGHALLSVRCAGGQVDYLTNRVQSNPEGSRLSKLNMSRYIPAPGVLQRTPPLSPFPLVPCPRRCPTTQGAWWIMLPTM